jgi:hypothetical protein
MKIIALARPFLLTTGTDTVLLTSTECQRLLDDRWREIAQAHRSRVRFANGTTLRPATTGGGPAFLVEP